MEKFFGKPRMLGEARAGGKGHKWFVEILIFLLLFFIAQMLQTIPVSIATVVWMFTSEDFLAALTSSIASGDLTEYTEIATEMTNHIPDWLMIVQLFSTVLTTAVAILFCRWIEKRTAASMGLRKGSVLREYLAGAAVGIVLISACVGLCWAMGGLTLSPSEFSVGMWLLYLVGFLIQGMSEEVLCRGYMMVSVSRKNAMWLAVLTNSVLFALLHLANPGIGILPLINIALFGILESIYVLKRGNLWGACAIHSLWNFFQGNVFGISVSGTGTGSSPFGAALTADMDWLNGGTFGIEGGIAVTLVIAAAILLTLFFLPKNAKEQEMSAVQTNDYIA